MVSDGEGDPIEVMDDDYDPGVPGHYFGGYGTCHRCGEFCVCFVYLMPVSPMSDSLISNFRGNLVILW